MRNFSFLIIFVLTSISLNAQTNDISNFRKNTSLTIEPAIAYTIFPRLGLSNIVQYNFNKRFCVVSLTSSYYSLIGKNMNFTYEYSYVLSQKFGFGITLGKNKVKHTFSYVGGIWHEAFKESFENPEIPEKISIRVNSCHFDHGLLYNLKLGKNKVFFSGRIYIPIITPVGVASIVDFPMFSSVDLGIGIRIK